MVIWFFYAKKSLTFLGVFLGFVAVVFGQNQRNLKPAVYLGLQAGTSSGKTTPFWLRANDYGQFPTAPHYVQAYLNVQQDYDSLFQKNSALKPFSMGYGGQVIIQQSNQTRLIVPEAFVKLRYKRWEFYGGRRKEIFGLTDTTHTSGSYIWSGNALPMPKIQIHTPKYVALGKKGRFSFNAGISHGWFGKDSVIQGHWLHQKWLYGRIGKPNAKFQVTAGVNHQVMWGGYSDILKEREGPFAPTIDGYLAPKPFYSYQYILIPFLQKFVSPDPDKVPGYDGGLAIGNQLGSVDLLFQFNGEKVHAMFYKQQPYDFARSLYNLNNIEDGLHGLSLSFTENKFLQNLTVEFFYSKSQGRYRFGKYQPSNYGEVDSYFFHGQYQSWSYQNQILGTPFILFEGQNQRQFNNRLKYYYFSVQGNLKPKLSYTLKQVFSRNFGTYSRSIDLSQYNGSLQLRYKSGSSNLFSGQFIIDSGTLYDQNIGLSLSWQHQLY